MAGGGGPWNNTRGRSLCLQVGVVVGGGGPWNNTRGRSVCLQVGVVVGGGLGTTHGAAVFVCRSSTK